jgi:hypothetical protein
MHLHPDTCYINSIDNHRDQIEELLNSQKFSYKIIDNSYPKIEEKYLNDNNIYNLAIQSYLDNDKIGNKSEWHADYYLEWRKTKEGEKYCINFLTEKVPLKFKAIVNNQDYDLNFQGGGNVSSLKATNENIINIYLSKPFIKDEDKPILNILEENKEFTEIKDEDFIKLQYLYIQKTEAILNNPKKQKDNKDINGSSGKAPNSHHTNTSNGNVNINKKLSKEAEKELNKLLDKIDEETLKKLAKNTDLLKKLADDLDETDAKKNPVTGYLGESLVFHWLKEKKKYNEVNYVADKKPEFDIEVKSGNEIKLIDVKTTIKNLKGDNGAIAFYIKSSQYKFIEQNPKDNYSITRLSLKDLGIEKEAREFYNKNKRDELSEQVKKEIDNFVINKFLSEDKNIKKLENTMMTFKIKYENNN